MFHVCVLCLFTTKPSAVSGRGSVEVLRPNQMMGELSIKYV